MKHVIIHILTIVLASTFVSRVAWGAPHSPEPNLDQEQAPKGEDPKTKEIESVTVTEPPKAVEEPHVVKQEASYFFPYQSSMGPRVGLLLDPSAEISLENPPATIFGFFYMLRSVTSRHYEVAADLHSNGKGSMSAVLKWVFRSTEKIRPFAKAGILISLVPDKGLANFVDIKQYMGVVGVGLEDLLKEPASLRWDVEIAAGLGGLFATVIFGYSWAW